MYINSYSNISCLYNAIDIVVIQDSRYCVKLLLSHVIDR